MDEAYNDIEKLEDPVTKSITSEYTSRARLLTKFNFTLGAVVSGFFSVYPFFASRGLPYGLWIPGIDIQSTPAYELVYILEVRVLHYSFLNTSLNPEIGNSNRTRLCRLHSLHVLFCVEHFIWNRSNQDVTTTVANGQGYIKG